MLLLEEEFSYEKVNNIVDEGIAKLNAITPQACVERIRLLNQIEDVPKLSQKVSGFLDYMIDLQSELEFQLWKVNSDINAVREKVPPVMKNEKEYINRRLNNIAKRLGIKPEQIEDELMKYKKRPQVSEMEEDYRRSCDMLSASPGKLSKELSYLKDRVEFYRRIDDGGHAGPIRVVNEEP